MTTTTKAARETMDLDRLKSGKGLMLTLRVAYYDNDPISIDGVPKGEGAVGLASAIEEAVAKIRLGYMAVQK